MESYRIEATYSLRGKEKVLRRNFSSLEECREWASENKSVEVMSGNGVYRVPITGYAVYRITEEFVYGE